MYGWRARIGYLVPSSGLVTEVEWRRAAPEGVLFVGARIYIQEVTPENVEAMVMQNSERAAREVASAEVQAIIQVGTPGGFLRPGLDQELNQLIQRAAGGIPTATMFTSIVDALKHLGLRRLAVATPYIESLDERLRISLTHYGFEVLTIKGPHILRNMDINNQHPDTSYRAAREAVAAAPDADGIFISCGGWRTFEIIDALEKDTGLPVVTSNTAGLWKGLRMVGVNEPIPGLGRLLAGEPSQVAART